MSLKMSRRGFVKASAVATASTLLLGASATAAAADEAAATSTSSDDVKIIPSACRQCYGRCALFGHVKDGRLVKIEGNPDLFSEGTLCGRCFAIPQELYNPLRVRYPQKRVGEKGSGQWKRITWEEAYEEARDRFTKIGEEHGWHTIAHQYGTGRDMLQFQAINKLWLELGSTATFGVGNLCWVGSYFSSQRLYGDETQYTGWDGNNTDCILIWCRQERSRGYYDWLTVKRAQERGAKVICVDPRFTCTASKADIWLPIRPGSDMALVLAFINEIVHSDKCATEFARMYTNAPFFIDEKDADGNGTGYQLRESYLKEDGNEELYAAWDENSDQLIFWSGDWQNAKGDPFQIYGYWQQTSEPILSIEGGHEIVEGFKNLDFFVNVDLYMTPSGELADIILPAAHPNEVDRVEWAHSGHGYPTSHTYLIRQPFHEPLGECRDDMDICFEFAEYMGVDMYWKDKYEFFDYMVKGPETLPPQLSCASFEDFRERVSVTGVEMATVKNAPKYETGFMRKTSDFRPGFNTMYRGNKMGSVYRFPGAQTPDGKVIPPHPQSDNGKMELWSEDLLLYGNGALPMYIEPPITKLSRPDLLDEYPYTLITGGRSHAFFHTEYRNSPWLREVHMFPTMDINPATAAEHGIEQDDWVYIETYVDRIKQRANLTEAIKPGMIHVEHDWWFPEREATDDLHGAFDSNCNVLFENNGPYDPAVGTDNFGGLCKVYKADDGAPKNICMNSEDLKIFLPLTAEALAADDQQNGVTQVTKGGAK